MATMPPKVLRIGVNLDGKLVKDKLIKPNETVTIGEGPKATIQLPPGLSPKPEFPMFSSKNGKTTLSFTEGMKGRVGTEKAAFTLQKIREEPPSSLERTADGWRLVLSEDDRGAITLGDNVRILFQFVSAPPSAPQKAPPVDFRPRFVEEDDTTLFGFLTLFSALGAVFIVFVMNTTVVEIDSITQLEDFADIVIVPEEPPKIDEPVVEDGDKKAETKADTKTETKAETKADRPAKSADEQRADQKRNLEASSQLLALLTAKGGDGSNGTAIDRFGDQDAGRVADALQASAGGVVISDGNNGPRKGDASGTGDVKMAQGGAIGGGGAVDAVKAPQVTITVVAGEGNTDEMTGDAGSVKATDKKNMPQLKYCYETALKANSELAGRVEIEWNVTGGRVTSTSVFANTTGDSAFASCIEGKVKKWMFPPEVAGEVQWPFVFKSSAK
jgi:hypothetical protein